MSDTFKKSFSHQEEQSETPERLRKGVDTIIKLFCKEFSLADGGKERITQILEQNPETTFVIAASHLSNLDAPAAVAALGDILDIQITAESVLFEGASPQRALFKLAGKESFTPLSYDRDKHGKHGVFNPEDFTRLATLVKQGKTPWMAVHPFTTEEESNEPGWAVFTWHTKQGL